MMGEGDDEVLNAVVDKIIMTSDTEIVELSRSGDAAAR
jgi:hypothetical protein